MLPDKYKIPYEPDPIKAENNELKNKIQKLQSISPSLKITFGENELYREFELPLPLFIREDEILEKLDQISQLYPSRNASIDGNMYDENRLLQDMVQETGFESLLEIMGDNIPEDEYSRYNEERERLLKNTRNYLLEENDYFNQKNRTIKLYIYISNIGTAPANDIDIRLHFPDGMQVLSEGDLPELPHKPTPPKLPRTQNQILSESFQNFTPPISAILSRSFLDNQYYPEISVDVNVSEPIIRKVNSYSVDIHVDKLKHRFTESFSPLYVLFDSYDTAKSFSIDYEVFAENIPEPEVGELNVKIYKKEIEK